MIIKDKYLCNLEIDCTKVTQLRNRDGNIDGNQKV